MALSKKQIIDENWRRYEYGRDRGHTDYIQMVKRNEEMYLGGGKQWTEEDKTILRRQKRPTLEFNEVLQTVNSAVGYQIQNRMDISFKPRNSESDQEVANLLSKVAKQVMDNNQYHWKETDVFEDGLIQQRGYFDIRLSFEDSAQGEIVVDLLDPLDVIPDPDAKAYHPDHWEDVIITRWMTLDEIEQFYGEKKRIAVENAHDPEADHEHDSSEERPKFGQEGTSPYFDMVRSKKGLFRVRVIDRQYWRMEKKPVVIFPTGDIRRADTASEEDIAQWEAQGALMTERRTRCVYWCVSTSEVLLYEGLSPYNHFTVVPYFPYFRRGQTRGIVDNIIGPQELLNKSMSQILHAINTTANSGWIIEQNSLSNMRIEDLEEKGSQTGLVLEYMQGSKQPEKIDANQIPAGLDRLVDRAYGAFRSQSGVNESLMGLDNQEMSGVAIQSRQFAGQQQLGKPLDNLARTRHMVATWFLDLIQGFYDNPRIIRITEQGQNGRDQDQFVEVNQVTDSGILNDLTIGEYDVVITEQPMSVTFENSQFEQAARMRGDLGIPIPDHYIVRHSTLSDKHALADQMEQQPPSPEEEKTKAEIAKLQADMERIKADTQRIANDAVNKSVEAQFSAIQTGQAIAQNPLISGISDALLRSAGYVDRDQPPIIPEGPMPPSQDPENNTNPLTPTNPDEPESPVEGVNRGIDTSRR